MPPCTVTATALPANVPFTAESSAICAVVSMFRSAVQRLSTEVTVPRTIPSALPARLDWSSGTISACAPAASRQAARTMTTVRGRTAPRAPKFSPLIVCGSGSTRAAAGDGRPRRRESWRGCARCRGRGVVL
ncbi:MAG TPA: hypothetical protein HA263_02775 [Methanoregulaceae archaeon]|nr:hypothetical protein [Methanoregulaceae archaeon]